MNERYISAFPTRSAFIRAQQFESAKPGSEYRCYDGGMTLRDYFAGQWIAGAGTKQRTAIEKIDVTAEDFARSVAKEAYLIADAMMEARDSASPCVTDV